MRYEPHELYLIQNAPTQTDANGDPIKGSNAPTNVFLCDCFLHDISAKVRSGYAGIGIKVTYYVNMDRRDDLKIGQRVVITENGSERGSGEIVDIKRTSGMHFAGEGEYTTIFI